MEFNHEQSVTLPHISVQLITCDWRDIEETPAYPGYNLSQRLSEDHSPLRIGNLNAPQVMPRVRSVGLLPPGQSIRLFPVERPLRVLHCLFDESYFEQKTHIARERWETHTNSLVLMRHKRLEIMMQEVCAELQQPGFVHELLIESVCHMMLVELARHLLELERKSRPGDALALSTWQLRKIQERIEASLQVGYPTLAELAELCNISEGHLARSYKTSTGWQIHKYIADERIKAAMTLLANDNLSCEDVATALGFKSAAYFSTAFRKVTGKSPTEFRKQGLSAE